MGQKVHPIGIRLGISADWTSTWYAGSANYADFLNNDLELRAYLKRKLSHASVSRIEIHRPARAALVTIYSQSWTRSWLPRVSRSSWNGASCSAAR